MNYSEHYNKITANFPKLDLIKESEFDLFKNFEFAKEIINLCIQLCENASEKLNIHIHFGILYNFTFNASATVENNSAVITFNLGLIDKLETLVSNSVEIFMKEIITIMTVQIDKNDNFKTIAKSFCITYLFYHELAHIIQLFKVKGNAKFTLQEQNSKEKHFNIKNHIYEFDADLFGSGMSSKHLLEKIINSNSQFETIMLFNNMTLLFFTIANIIIEFNGNSIQSIYYKENSHPHPLIRILKCFGQISSSLNQNLNFPNELLEATLERTRNMISQISYSDGRKVNFQELYSVNFDGISKYNDEIEELNNDYNELVRHKSQEILNALN